MRILIYGINFAPELTGTGKYTGEMAAWLTARGHKVVVVTAPPYYPQWRVAKGYTAARYRRQRWALNEEEALVWRCPLWVPKSPGGFQRLVHLCSFALSSAPVVLAQAAGRPDMILVVAPTLFCAPTALLAARLAGARTWLHIQDFEVDAAFGVDLLRSSRLRRLLLAVERMFLRGFDRVSTISDRMVERLADKGVPPARQVMFPNWADTNSVRPLGRPSAFRRELGLANDVVVALYAGNLGRKQGLEVLVEAIAKTRDDPHITWVIAGAGSARDRMEAQTVGLSNVKWLPLQPSERLNELLNLADIHILPQRANAADLVMPSKLTGMLASGRPVVATAAPETQVARVVLTCGVRVPPEDAQALAAAVVDLADAPERRESLGKSAREYAERNLSYDVIMANFEKQAMALVDGAAQPATEKK